MGSWQRGVRRFLNRHFLRLSLVMVILVLLGGFVTYTAHVETDTHIEERPGPTAVHSGDFTHNATVVAENSVFAVNETLTEREVYFGRVAPVLNGSFTYTYTATDGGRLRAAGNLSLVIRSVEEGGGGEPATEYWRLTRPLDSVNATRLDPGEKMTLSFGIDVPALRSEVEQIDRELGSDSGEVRIRVVADVATRGNVNGLPVSSERSYELGIEPDESLYRVEDPGAVVNETTQIERVRVTSEPGTARGVGGPLTLAVGLVGLLALVGARLQDLLFVGIREEAYAEFTVDRREYDEWITTATLPTTTFDGAVEVDSLEGLVDVAIDSNRRVIEDPNADCYVVFVDDRVYTYDAPSVPDDLFPQRPER